MSDSMMVAALGSKTQKFPFASVSSGENTGDNFDDAADTARSALAKMRDRVRSLASSNNSGGKDAVLGGVGRYAKVLEECAAADAEGVVVPAAAARAAAIKAALLREQPPAVAPPRRGTLREALVYSRGVNETDKDPGVTNKYALAARARVAAARSIVDAGISAIEEASRSPPRDSHQRPPSSPINL